MKKNNTLSKIANIVWVVVIVVLLALVVVSLAGKNSGRPTFIFNRAVLWVETGSMEPTIETRSFVSVVKSDGQNLSVGDVITFVCTDKSQTVYGLLVTHRIEAVVDGGYKTKGDNTANVTDPWIVRPDDVVAVYTGNLPLLTWFGRVFSSWAGIAMIALVFVLAMSFVYIPDLVRAARSDIGEKADNAKQQQIDRLVAEEVARLNREGLGCNDDTKNNKEVQSHSDDNNGQSDR